MADNSSVQKSVRLSAELVEYIESCEGADFSKKLVGILDDYRFGISTRAADLKRLREKHDDYTRQINQLADIAARGRNAFISVEVAISRVSDYNKYLRSALEDPEDLKDLPFT